MKSYIRIYVLFLVCTFFKSFHKRKHMTYLYILYFNLASDDRQMILSAIDEYKKLTCLKFTPRTSSDADYIYFTNGNTGCWSSVGKIGGRQEVYYFKSYILYYMIKYLCTIIST